MRFFSTRNSWEVSGAPCQGGGPTCTLLEDHDSDVVANALVALLEILEDDGGLEVRRRGETRGGVWCGSVSSCFGNGTSYKSTQEDNLKVGG